MNKISLQDKEKSLSNEKYDKGIQIETLMSVVDYVYELTGEIKATANELGMHPDRVKKLLITSEKISYDETSQIRRLQAYGMKMEDIQKELNLKKSALNSYLPYSKVPYKECVISANAERCDLYRKRKEAVNGIVDTASLMIALRLFQDYTFVRVDGDTFKYVVLKKEGDVSGLQIYSGGNTEIISITKVLESYEKVRYVKDDDDTVGKCRIGDAGGAIEAIFKRFNLIGG